MQFLGIVPSYKITRKPEIKSPTIQDNYYTTLDAQIIAATEGVDPSSRRGLADDYVLHDLFHRFPSTRREHLAELHGLVPHSPTMSCRFFSHSPSPTSSNFSFCLQEQELDEPLLVDRPDIDLVDEVFAEFSETIRLDNPMVTPWLLFRASSFGLQPSPFDPSRHRVNINPEDIGYVECRMAQRMHFRAIHAFCLQDDCRFYAMEPGGPELLSHGPRLA